MSLILDALRRAERARDKDLTRRVSESAAPPLRRKRGVLLPVLLLAGVVIAALVVFWPREEQPQPATPVVTSPAPAAQPAATARGSSLADITVPLPEAEPPAPVRREPVPLYAELPATQRTSVPAPSVDAHFWSEDPARRFVLLDMSRFRAGDVVRPGLRVVEIHPDSVELDWQGTRFRLPAQ